MRPHDIIVNAVPDGAAPRRGKRSALRASEAGGLPRRLVREEPGLRVLERGRLPPRLFDRGRRRLWIVNGRRLRLRVVDRIGWRPR
jgi:hypothetical protein